MPKMKFLLPIVAAIAGLVLISFSARAADLVLSLIHI